MPDLMAFTVTVEQLTGGVRVKVDAGDPGFAEVFAPDTRVALEMAVPYMHALSVPDPLADLFRLPPAVDGPPDMGGS